MATKKQGNDFILMIAPIAVEICKQKKKKVLPSVCTAQACCESGYGTSPKMVNAKAVFGIKVGKSKVHFGTAWKDKAYDTKTKECYDGKTYVKINDFFRAYDSIRDSVEDYYDMLGACSRYAGCIGELDYVKAITAIKNGGYATSPTYISTITSIIKKYNLTQYDTCMTGKEELPILRKGSKGYYVGYLQEKLNALGYNCGKIDRDFGSNTELAVEEFQSRNGLMDDGVVGAKTWAKLNGNSIRNPIIEYSLKKDGNVKISANFSVKEFKCKDGSDKILIDTEMVKALQKIRDHFKAPVTINSGYRTVAYNKKVGGSTNSYHMKGQAFDIVVKGKTPAEVAAYAYQIGIPGIIQYNTFVHVDSRATKYYARNDNGNVTKVSKF